MLARLVPALLASFAVISPAAFSQAYPSKPIRMVVPFARKSPS